MVPYGSSFCLVCFDNSELFGVYLKTNSQRNFTMIVDPSEIKGYLQDHNYS